MRSYSEKLRLGVGEFLRAKSMSGESTSVGDTNFTISS